MILEQPKNYLQIALNALLLTTALGNVLLLLAVILTKYYGLDLGQWLKQPIQAAFTVTQPANPPSQVELEQNGLVPEAVSQNVSLTVPPKQSIEFKFAMDRDYTLDYRWDTDGKPLYAELRGQKPDDKNQAYKVFGKLKHNKGKGFFIVPFNGHYALSWQNKTDKPVTVRLTITGVYKVLG